MVRIRARVKTVPGTWGRLDVDPAADAASREAQAQTLLDQLSLEEKIAQMGGDTPLLPGLIEMVQRYNERPLPAGENHRLGIPGLRFSDGPRGVVLNHSTCFPVAMARGATWDPDLESRIGDAMGVEARVQGANFFGGVCINLLRHPAWGRAQETYGEDPYHVGELGAALVQGLQRHVMACIKHFACNSIENARFKVDVQVDERTLREVYLPHFKRCVEAGAAAVMSAYNRVNGVYCSHNRHLLRDILKQAWGFTGFVISDFFFAVQDAGAAAVGLDVEMPFTWRFGRKLKRAVHRGRVSPKAIDEAVLRILRQKLRFATVGEPERYTPDAVVSAQHRALAREAAQRSMVLLKNAAPAGTSQPLLPLDPAQIRRLAVVGPRATDPNLGDQGSSRVYPPTVVTPLAGLERASAGRFEVLQPAGPTTKDAVTIAEQADAVVVVAGYTHAHEGEYIKEGFRTRGGDRTSLTLPPSQEALIRAVAAANPRTIVVLIGGSAIITEAWRKEVAALLMAWYPGMEGGHALADILLGTVNPSGKLPCTFPRTAAQLPDFDPDADRCTYDYFHGYWKLDREAERPAFPFGFGLSYTTYAYTQLEIETPEIGPTDVARIAVTVTNTGTRAGAEVAQLYVGCNTSAVPRPGRKLQGFQPVTLAPGASQRIVFELPAQQLAYYAVEEGAWVVEPAQYQIYVGPSSQADTLLRGTLQVTGL